MGRSASKMMTHLVALGTNYDDDEDDDEEITATVTHSATRHDSSEPKCATNSNIQSNDIQHIFQKENSSLDLEDNVTQLRQLMINIISANDSTSIQDFISNTNLWMNSLYQFIENAPVGISIAKATKCKNHISFPLIFVNKHFEKISKFSRHEILGHNCNMMQAEAKTEMCQKEKIRKHLEARRSLRIAITNVRKDGSSFLNFLCLHPIMDGKGVCTHYFGLQYELTGNEKHFHHDLLLKHMKEKIEIKDFSDWLKRNGGSAEKYYQKYLTIFVCFGVLFENFFTWGDEADLTNNLVLKNIEEIQKKFKVKPLIVKITDELEGDLFWYTYESFIKKIINDKM
jgi:PAS domain S-box-containing protein